MRQLPIYPVPPVLALDTPEELPPDRTCERCSLHAGVRSRCIEPEVYGDRSNGSVLVLGQGPGDEEDKQDRPNVGLSGQYLRKFLRENWKGEVIFDNAVRCFGSETEVQALGASKVYRRFYSGPMVRVATRDNGYLTGTPNHPVLTQRGWVALGEVKQGDYLVRSSFGEPCALGNPDVDARPTKFGELFDAATNLARTERRAGAHMDFHGDGREGEIDVVPTDSLLRNRLVPSCTEHVPEFLLEGTNRDECLLSVDGLPTSSAFDLSAVELDTAKSGVSGSCVGTSLFRSALRVGAQHHFACGANLKPEAAQVQSERRGVEADLLPERLAGFASQVTFAEITDVLVTEFSGHVFNLETDCGWYSASGYIVHNCKPGATKITDKMLDACRPYVRGAYREAAPQRIVCLGAAAIHSVVGRSFPPYSVRKGYTHLADGTPVFFLAHPVNALQNRFRRRAIEEDFLWALTADPPVRPHRAVALMVETPEQARQAREDLEFAGITSWDLETFANPYDPEFLVLNASFVPGGCDYVYMLETKAYYDQEVGRAMLETLRDLPSGGHNIKFDAIGVRASLGFWPDRIVFDTQSWRRLLESDVLVRLENAQALVGMAGAKDEMKAHLAQASRELRAFMKNPAKVPTTWLQNVDLYRVSTAGRRVEEIERRPPEDEDAKKKQDKQIKRFLFAGTPPTERARYNALDSLSTDKLRLHLEERFKARPDLFNVWTTIQQELVRAVTRMEFNGILADPNAIDSLSLLMHEQVKSVKGELIDATGNSEFNLKSAKQVGDYLFDTLKLTIPGSKKPPERSPKSGQYITKEDVIVKLKHPWVDKLLQYRKASHFKAQYADGMRAFIRSDGRIHPNFKVEGTEGSRPSCEQPNLLNIPRPKHIVPLWAAAGKLCRNIFIAPPGYKLVEADYSQIELRVAAMRSGDPLMIRIFQEGGDFHLQAAKLVASIFGLNADEITKDHPLRDRSKAVVFGALYGEPAAALAKKLGIATKLAETLQNAIFGTFKQLKAYLDECLRTTQRTGTTRSRWRDTLFRERPLWAVGDIGSGHNPARDTDERSSWNTPIQAEAADFTNDALGVLQREYEAMPEPAPKLVLTVYDAIITEVRDDMVQDIARRKKRIMERWSGINGMPIVAEVKYGQSWGDMKGLELEVAS